jgi:hypothetical protein
MLRSAFPDVALEVPGDDGHAWWGITDREA